MRYASVYDYETCSEVISNSCSVYLHLIVSVTQSLISFLLFWELVFPLPVLQVQPEAHV